MLYILLYVFYAITGIWWSQVCLNMMPFASGLSLDDMNEKERFIAILMRLPFHAFLWPISIVYMIFKTDKDVVFTAMTEFQWEMTFRK